jgi:hypothetical protein
VVWASSIEAVMLNALAPLMTLEQITAGLFVYRVVYYLVPFLAGILFVILGEFYVLARQHFRGEMETLDLSALAKELGDM